MKKHTAQLVAIALAFGGTSAAWADEDVHFIAKPDTLVWKDATSLPRGAKLALIEGNPSEPGPFTFRVRFPANFDIPAHWHPAIEHVTVISGAFNIGEGDKLDRSKTRAIPVGGFSFMAPRHNHFAWTGEETIIQAHGVGPWGITYVNPADDPRKQ